MSKGERRLAAVMFTDIVGFTAMSQRDEKHALKVLESHNNMLRPIFARHGGKEVKTIGDSFLVEFASALAATECAIEIQRMLTDFNEERKDSPIWVRIGLHLGDVIRRDNDIFGDAVNVASRIHPLAEPGGICVSEEVYSVIRNKIRYPIEMVSAVNLKNVELPMNVYTIALTEQKRVVLGSHRVAVLPFASMSPNPDDEYLADGMTEEVISTLSRVPDIEVISRTSVMHYKKNPKTIKEVSKELDVGTVLEGSVRKAGNRLRITIQMIDATRDRHLWAESYDRELEDIFAIQSELAARVAQALTIKPLHGKQPSSRKSPTANIEAYTLYLKGRYYWNKRGPENIKTAMKFFEQAVGQDPGFALGYVGLADCRMLLSNLGIDWEKNRDKSKEALAKALELEPELAEAQASNGFALMGEFRFREAEERFRKALEMNPNYAPAHLWYSHLLRAQRRSNEALEQIEKAVALDPLSANMYTNLAGYYYEMRDDRTALDLGKRAAELDPTYAVAHFYTGQAYGKMKMFDDARREYGIALGLLRQTYPHVSKWVDTQLAYMEDDRARLRRLLPEVEANANEAFAGATEIAFLYFYLGEDDKGFRLLDEAYSKRDYGLLFVQSDPEIPDRVRNDPRYSKLMEKLGLN